MTGTDPSFSIIICPALLRLYSPKGRGGGHGGNEQAWRTSYSYHNDPSEGQEYLSHVEGTHGTPHEKTLSK